MECELRVPAKSGVRFSLLRLARRQTEQALAESSLLALNASLEVNAALLVDKLAGLRSGDAFAASEPPEPSAPAYFGPTHLDAQGVRWQEIDLQALSQHPVFLGISI